MEKTGGLSSIPTCGAISAFHVFFNEMNRYFLHVFSVCYLKMDNLVSDLEKPCIMDLKIGKKTFDPFAAADKVQRELIRYKYQAQLGFRLTGFKVSVVMSCCLSMSLGLQIFVQIQLPFVIVLSILGTQQGDFHRPHNDMVFPLLKIV